MSFILSTDIQLGLNFGIRLLTNPATVSLTPSNSSFRNYLLSTY